MAPKNKHKNVADRYAAFNTGTTSAPSADQERRKFDERLKIDPRSAASAREVLRTMSRQPAGDYGKEMPRPPTTRTQKRTTTRAQSRSSRSRG